MSINFEPSNMLGQIDLTREDEVPNIDMSNNIMDYNSYDDLSTVTEDTMEEGGLGTNEVILLVVKTLSKHPELLKGNFGYRKLLMVLRETILRESGVSIQLEEFFTVNKTFQNFIRLLYSGAIVNNRFDKEIRNPYKVCLLSPGQEKDISYHKLSNGRGVYKSYPTLNKFSTEAFEELIRSGLGEHKVNSLSGSITDMVLKAGRIPPVTAEKVDVNTLPLLSNLEVASMIMSGEANLSDLKKEGFSLQRIQAISKLVKVINDSNKE